MEREGSSVPNFCAICGSKIGHFSWHRISLCHVCATLPLLVAALSAIPYSAYTSGRAADPQPPLSGAVSRPVSASSVIRAGVQLTGPALFSANENSPPPPSGSPQRRGICADPPPLRARGNLNVPPLRRDGDSQNHRFPDSPGSNLGRQEILPAPPADSRHRPRNSCRPLPASRTPGT